MLIQPRFSVNHRRALKRGWALMCRKPLATLMTIGVIASTLMLPALGWFSMQEIKQWGLRWQQGEGRIALYLAPSLGEQEVNALLGRVRSQSGVLRADMISPQEGLLALQHDENLIPFLKEMGDNPLPAVIDVLPSLNDPSALHALHETLRGLKGVEHVTVDIEWMQQLHRGASFVARLIYGGMGFLVCVAMLVLGNTFRLHVLQCGDEIQMLMRIGATDAFILRPFIYAGLGYGIAGASIAALGVSVCYVMIHAVLKEALVLQDGSIFYSNMMMLRHLGVFVLMTVLLSCLSVMFAVKRQLKHIEITEKI